MSFVLKKLKQNDYSDVINLDSYSNYLDSQRHVLLESYKGSLQKSITKLEERYALSAEALKADLIKESEEFSQKLYDENFELISKFLERFEGGIVEIVTQVLSKVGLFNVSAGQISELLQGELSSFIGGKNVTIRANVDTINYLKFCIEPGSMVGTYERDDSVKDGCCIISDGKFVIFTNVPDAINKIKDIINKEFCLLSAVPD